MEYQMVQGVLRLHSKEYGGCWVPVFVSSQQRKNSEVYWPVSLTLTQLTCIVCTATQPIPQVTSPASSASLLSPIKVLQTLLTLRLCLDGHTMVCQVKLFCTSAFRRFVEYCTMIGHLCFAASNHAKHASLCC